jgi:hypothetical protein
MINAFAEPSPIDDPLGPSRTPWLEVPALCSPPPGAGKTTRAPLALLL